MRSRYRSVFSTGSDAAYVLNGLGIQSWDLVAIGLTSTDKNNNALKGATYAEARA